MNKLEFAKFIEKGYVLLDGATGSNLMKKGMPAGVCPEKWILENPDGICELQSAYVEAGTDILYAPTFTANRIKLEEYGLGDKQEQMINDLVGLCKKSAAGKALVAGDLTMTGRQLKPTGNLSMEELIDVYKEQIILMEKAGVDLLVVETMMSLGETRAALIAAKEVSELPIIATMTFEASGKTLFGSDAATCAIVLDKLGADAIGVNCSTGPAKMVDIIESMAQVTKKPLIAKPNAGLPAIDENGNTYYDMGPETFAEEMKLLMKAGAQILGGCCGTDPRYIALLKENTKDQKVMRTIFPEAGIRRLSSERESFSFGLNDPFFIVGERINPTGKKKLQEELRNGSLDMVSEFAKSQEEAGASVLDVNMGMSGIDEKEMMLASIEEISLVTNLPLSLDSSHIDVLEAALRNYHGRALVNSVSYETEKFEKLLPIVKKYGAMFILLPLSDEGLPKDLQEKMEIIQKIYDRAIELGMEKEDIVVDGLVATVGANKMAALETLETIRYCKENGLATICGLSNISFGMPERIYVNTAFLTMAIQAGLTMAIANPSQQILVCGAYASDLLLAKKDADLKYIEYASNMTKLVAENKSAALEKAGEGKVGENKAEGAGNDEGLTPWQKNIKEAVVKGNRKGIGAMTQKALDEGEDAQNLLNVALLPAINLVGDYFEKKKYFLPQLIASAEAMKNGIEVLEPHLVQGQSDENMPVVIIATVEGDIHDIGKNLVALMLKNYGFKVIDLGKDVPKEVIIEKAKEYKADIIALSALMTTTMKRMKEVIDYAKKMGVTSKVMIGGAVITQEYADEISADGYSKDAADAVKLAKRLMGMMTQ